MNEMQTARALIKKFKTNNPFEICQCLNSIVLFVPLIDVRGFYQYFDRSSIIYINQNLDEREQYFVCAHELGHAVMHKNSNEVFMSTRTYMKTSTYEQQADRFAIDLLLPDDDFIDDYEDLTIEQISKCFGMNQELMKYRIGIINK